MPPSPPATRKAPWIDDSSCRTRSGRTVLSSAEPHASSKPCNGHAAGSISNVGEHVRRALNVAPMTATPADTGPYREPVSVLGGLAACWACVGVIGLLGFAIARLSLVVAAGLEMHWDWPHWLGAAVNAAFMAWSEGYRGFQLRFSPRSAARVKWLAHHPSPLRTALAPLFAMGYFQATGRRMIGVYALTGFVVVAIVVVHTLPQPWRAALDIGVIIGLAWGAASFLWSLQRTFAVQGFPVSPELPPALTVVGNEPAP